MPTYRYRCEDCGDEFEVWQSITDDALTTHDEDGGHLVKVLSPAGIVLKGSGFYKTDNRSGSRSTSKNGDGSKDSSGTKSDGSSSDSKGDSSGSSGSKDSGSKDSGSKGSGSKGSSSTSSGSGSKSSSASTSS